MKVTSLVALAALIGAVQPMAAEAKDKVFALVPKAMNNPFFDQARDGCMKAAKEIGGIQCLFIGPADATEQEQVQVVQDLITKHVDGIGVSAANAPAIANSWPGRRKLIFLSSPGTAICCRPTRDFAPLTSARSTKRSAKRSPNRRWR